MNVFPAEIREAFVSNRALRVVLLTDFFFLLSELSAVVILPWWITSRGGAHAIAAFSVTLAIATFFVAPAVSPFGDRICKGRQITWGLGCLCLVAAAQVGLSFAGVFSLPALTTLAVVQVLAASFVNPARDAVLTELLPQAQLPVAIRMRKTTLAISGILGPLLAGAAMGSAGVTGALCFYGGLLAVALVTGSRIPRATASRSQRKGLGGWWSELRAGLAAKWLVPMERGWTLVNFAVWIFQGPAVGLLIPIKVHSLGLPGHWLGLGLGALSLGVLLGSIFGSQRLVDHFGRYRVRVGLGFLEGIALAFVGWVASPYLMLLGLTIAGFCNASMALVGATHRALAIPREYRVRMFAAASMTTQVAGAIGPALVGMALARYSVTWVYTSWGLLMATCVLGFLAVPRLKEFLSLDHAAIGDWYRLQYPAAFK
ncbi:MFS transporter [Ideonella sp. YS5]|uniref:MFS transporter n=1 Tax=Ideonella sp. YS5 TaxID=3453714 RepID=UPI003EEB8EBB